MPTTIYQRAARHAVAAVLSLVLFLLFLSIRPEAGVHSLNRSFADAAFVLLVLTMILGPLSRLAPGVRPLLTWRHELGVWTILLAFGHLYVILDGWVHWDITGFYLIPAERTGGVELIDRSFLMGNVMGAIALIYGLILLATSNRWALKKLGKSWRYVQAASRVYILLIVVHSAYFLFWHLSNLPDARPSVFSTPFLVLTALLYSMVILGFFATLNRNKRRLAAARERSD